MTVAVITSSIGRPELDQCIYSVKAQTYPAKHFVYVNGPKWHESAKATLDKHPSVRAIYLPEETGHCEGQGPSMAAVFAAAPYLTQAEWIFYLNDDDFYDPDHIESVMGLINRNELKWAYSLRKFVDVNGNYICDDDWCSLGHYPQAGTDSYCVDNSCFAVHRSLAIRYGAAWTALPFIQDRTFLAALQSSKAPYGCSGLSTVNYRVGLGTAVGPSSDYLRYAEMAKADRPEGFPWRKAEVFNQPIHPLDCPPGV